MSDAIILPVPTWAADSEIMPEGEWNLLSKHTQHKINSTYNGLQARIADLQADLENARDTRNRELGNNTLDALCRVNAAAVRDLQAENASLLAALVEANGRAVDLEAEIAKLRSVFVEAQKKVHAGYHGVGTPIEECGDMNCIAAIKAGA